MLSTPTPGKWSVVMPRALLMPSRGRSVLRGSDVHMGAAPAWQLLHQREADFAIQACARRRARGRCGEKLSSTQPQWPAPSHNPGSNAAVAAIQRTSSVCARGGSHAGRMIECMRACLRACVCVCTRARARVLVQVLVRVRARARTHETHEHSRTHSGAHARTHGRTIAR
jgi:hypothetical protein